MSARGIAAVWFLIGIATGILILWLIFYWKTGDSGWMKSLPCKECKECNTNPDCSKCDPSTCRPLFAPQWFDYPQTWVNLGEGAVSKDKDDATNTLEKARAWVLSNVGT